ncbi:LCP family protein [Radiobacillus sp. PE A8.2]|uniref:LCP family protein n=1 Tax=Radiobacillus sp. PE A8.2 TaxID=3380349 RepID=UPI00388F9E5F
MSKQNDTSRSEKRITKNKRKKRILFILLPIMILLASATIYGTSLLNKADEIVGESFVDDGRDGSELRKIDIDPKRHNVSILFIGVDDSEKRSDSNPRSDALVLATLNKEDKSVKLLSIPRDSYVYIPEVGYEDKITHAHAFGGPKATIEAVEGFLDIPVDYYVKMDFEAFIDVVNVLDGVKVNVPYELYEQNSEDVKNAIHLLPGEQKLNGEEALALARTRKYDSDIERGKRQQEIIKAIAKQTLSFSSIFKVNNLMEAVGNNMTTNLTFDELKSFASYGTSSDLNIDTINITGDDKKIDGIYYYELDQDDLLSKSQQLQKHLGILHNNS